jgi:hypothetical protein
MTMPRTKASVIMFHQLVCPRAPSKWRQRGPGGAVAPLARWIGQQSRDPSLCLALAKLDPQQPVAVKPYPPPRPR